MLEKEEELKATELDEPMVIVDQVLEVEEVTTQILVEEELIVMTESLRQDELEPSGTEVISVLV